jgi:putative thioredoxin
MTAGAVIEANDQTFQDDVIQRSFEVPVVVDFWATWCGPCHTLSPVIERVAAAYAGRVQLVKVDIDHNPAVASRFGIQSIPMVVAFRDGVPVSDFLGAQPEPEVRSFFDSILPTQADALAVEGGRALAEGDAETARARFEAALEHDPGHRAATVGLASALARLGDHERAAELAARWPADSEAKQVLALVHMQRAAAGADRTALEARLADDDDDAEAHYRLGALLATEERWEPALEHLLAAVALDRALDEDGARLRMLEVFELLGPGHPLVDEYRRRLTNVLF